MLTVIPFGSVVSWRIPPNTLSFPTNIFDYAQNYFTGYPETHASILMHKLEPWNINAWYDFEASDTVRINVYNFNQNSTIFDILAPIEVKIKVVNKLIDNNYGNIYGFMQTFYFIIRWAASKFGWDARKWVNPFHWGKICSELVYDYLFELATEMKWYNLENLLNQWRADNFHAGDVRVVLNWMVANKHAILIYGV